MKKYGMLMTPENAQKCFDGTETITRRLIKPQPPETHTHFCDCDVVCQKRRQEEMQRNERPQWRWYHHTPTIDDPACKPFTCRPKYNPGDIVAIKETHWRWGYWEIKGLSVNDRVTYQFVPTDTSPIVFEKPGLLAKKRTHCGYHKRQSLYLPFDLARTHWEILSVRPERVQDITHADCMAEGIEYTKSAPLSWHYQHSCALHNFATAVEAFESLWDSINPDNPWASNPWVWRYEGRKVTP